MIFAISLFFCRLPEGAVLAPLAEGGGAANPRPFHWRWLKADGCVESCTVIRPSILTMHESKFEGYAKVVAEFTGVEHRA